MGRNVAVGVLSVVGCLLGGTAFAETRAGQDVVVPRGDVVREDLYAAGGSVRINGVVEGDLIAAGREVEINGEVKGDVLAASPNLRVNGPVGGSIRAMGGQMHVTSTVAEDLVFMGGTLDLLENGSVGRDLLAMGGALRVAGAVKRDFDAGGGEVVIGAPIGGSANVRSDQLRLTNSALVAGTLTYSSRNPIDRAPGAKVGAVEQITTEGPRTSPVAGFLYRWVRAVVAFAVLGIVLALLFPRFSRAVPQTLKAAPWQSLGYGALLFVFVPVIAVLVTALGALLGGWWLGLLVVFAFVTALALSFPAVGYLVGNMLVRNLKLSTSRRVMALIAGVAIVTLAIRIPLLGIAIGLGVILFGLGALLLSGLDLRRQAPPVAA